MAARCILVTRAQPGAGETAARLVSMGHSPLVAPMLELRGVARVPDMNLDRAGGLIFSSANGVRFFSEVSDRRDLAAWCVGPGTLSAAREAGFVDLHHANGDVHDLFALIVAGADRQAGPLIHVANTQAAGDLVARLEAAGIAAQFAGLYKPVPAKCLPVAAAAALEAGEIAAILVHSAKGATALATCLGTRETGAISLVAVSENAAAPLAGRAWKRTSIAARPNEMALLEALDAALTAP